MGRNEKQAWSGKKYKEKLRPKKGSGKCQDDCLWDYQEIILVAYLEKADTLTSTHYASILDRLKIQLQRKWSYKEETDTVVFLQVLAKVLEL